MTPLGGRARAGGGRDEQSIPPVRRTLAGRAGLAAEVVAAIWIAGLIVILVLMLDPSLTAVP